jgi:hypothetical protein
MTDVAAIKARYRRFADVECRGYSEAYYRLAHLVAADDVIVNFIAALPDGQPNLLFASIQFLTGPEGMPETGLELRRFLNRRGGEVRDIARARRTQTNEVGRCAVILPALPPGPLALVEVGASAGLCLLLDRFHYTWGSTAIGPAASPVHLHCAVTGPVPLPSVTPEIVWRHGLDIHPLDVRDDDAARWLRACVWPDQPERRRRLDGAIELARACPPLIRAGDLVDALPGLLAAAPEDAELVIFHSAVLSYVSSERRHAFALALAEASMRRDIVWISNEATGIVDDIAAQAPRGHALRFSLWSARFTRGQRHAMRLGFAHPHGLDLSWHPAGDAPAAPSAAATDSSLLPDVGRRLAHPL